MNLNICLFDQAALKGKGEIFPLPGRQVTSRLLYPKKNARAFYHF